MSFQVVFLVLVVASLPAAVSAAPPDAPPGEAAPAWRHDLARARTSALVITAFDRDPPSRAGADPDQGRGSHAASTTVRLWSSFPDGATVLCSGALVGPGHVLTSGGCVHHPQRGGWASAVRVATSDADGDAGAVAAADALTAMHAWVASADPRFDVGVVTLDEPLGLALGWRSVTVVDDADLAGSIHTSGFARSLGDDLVAHGAGGRLAQIGRYELAHRLELPPGMNGAPIRLVARPHIVAVQASTARGTATRVSELVVGLVRAARDDGSHPRDGHPLSPFAPDARRPDPSAHLKVIGDDDLEAVIDSAAYPFSAVVKLWATFPSGERYACSGAMIGPSTALTAAHCVHDAARGGRALGVEIAPGYSRDVAPFGVHTAAGVSVPGPWVDGAAPDWDIAAVHLDDTSLGLTTGWLGVAADAADTLRADLKTLVGFPGERDGGRVMHRAIGPLEAIHDEQVTHRVDTLGGMSGGPMWRTDETDGGIYVVVVHAWSSRERDHNGGTRISHAKLAAISAWLEQRVSCLAVPEGSCATAPRDEADGASPRPPGAPASGDDTPSRLEAALGCASGGAASSGVPAAGVGLAVWIFWVAWRSRQVHVTDRTPPRRPRPPRAST